MGAIIALVIIVGIAAIIVSSTIIVVKEQSAVIVERLGKYRTTLKPGIHFIVPFVDRVATTVQLRVLQNTMNVDTKTKDNVSCSVNVAVQFNVNTTKIKESYYTLQSPKPQIESYIQDAVRSAVPALTLDEAYERKDDIAKDVKTTVAEGMAAYGYVINNVLITELTPDASVVKAMNSINAAQRMKDAAQQQAEADRIKTVTKATADAEAAKLQGEGIANQRKAIADGLAEQLSTLQKTGVDSREVIELLMMTQYFNTMENIGGDGKVVFMRGDAGGYQEAVQQLMASTGAKD